MPLIRSSAATAAVDVMAEPCEALLTRLAGSDPDERRHAARALAREPAAAAPLAAHLSGESDPAVRDAIFSSLVEIGGDRVAALFAELMRSDNAGLRSGAIEGLKRLDLDAVSVLDTLLGDADPDIRLLAIEVTRAWPAELAVPRLRRLIENDPHVNVCAAAVDVATEAGSRDLLAPLVSLCARFPRETFLLFAVNVACDRIDATTDRDA